MNATGSLEGLKILLVEDVAANCMIAERILTKHGGSVVTVHNGAEAVNCFLTSPKGTFAAILMDIRMPVLDGWRATEKIRLSTHPDAKTIPIIAVTAEPAAENMKKCLDCGMNCHVEKPYDHAQLIEAILKLIQR